MGVGHFPNLTLQLQRQYHRTICHLVFCLVHPAFGRPCCISAPNLQLQQFDRLSILALALALGSGTRHSTCREQNKRTSEQSTPLRHCSRSSLNRVEPVIAMSRKQLRSVVEPYARISPNVSVAIVETKLMSLMSDEPCRRDDEYSLEEGARGVESRTVALVEVQNTLAV